MADRVTITHKLTWLSLTLLLVLQLIESAIQQPPLLIWVVRVMPLLIFVPGMLKDNLRSYIWACFVCLLYFISLVERLFADPDSGIAILAMVSVVGLFVSAMLYVRWRARQLKSLQGPAEPESVEQNLEELPRKDNAQSQ